MAEGEESLGSSDASTARCMVEAIARGDDMEVRLGEPLLPLQTLSIVHLLCSKQLGLIRSATRGAKEMDFER